VFVGLAALLQLGPELHQLALARGQARKRVRAAALAAAAAALLGRRLLLARLGGRCLAPLVLAPPLVLPLAGLAVAVAVAAVFRRRRRRRRAAAPASARHLLDALQALPGLLVRVDRHGRLLEPLSLLLLLPQLRDRLEAAGQLPAVEDRHGAAGAARLGPDRLHALGDGHALHHAAKHDWWGRGGAWAGCRAEAGLGRAV
jgi:hypothetical protein